MLIISHDDDIISEGPQLGPVKILIEGHRHGDIHRQDKIVLPAGHRQLAHELHVVIAHIVRNIFQVKIEPVNARFQACADQIAHQRFPHLGGGENNGGGRRVTEIIHQRPHLQAGSVRLLHIFSIRDARHISLVVRKPQPGRRNDVHPAHILHSLLEGRIFRGVSDHVPHQADFFVQALVGNDDRLILPGELPLLFIFQVLTADIPDKTVLGHGLLPAFPCLFVQDPQHAALFQVRHDRLLDGRPKPHHAALFHIRGKDASPLIIDHHVESLCRAGELHVHIRLQEIRVKIKTPLMHHHNGMACRQFSASGPVSPASERDLPGVIRRGKEHHLISLIPVKPGVEILPHHLVIEIERVVEPERPAAESVILQDDGHLTVLKQGLIRLLRLDPLLRGQLRLGSDRLLHQVRIILPNIDPLCGRGIFSI